MKPATGHWTVISALDDAKHEISELAGVIGAPTHLLPTYGRTKNGARPHIEESGGVLSLVVIERGEELDRRVAADLDELKYWVFESVTHSMASNWELHHRVEEQDSRILVFTHQLELLERLSPRWAERYREENCDLLRRLGVD